MCKCENVQIEYKYRAASAALFCCCQIPVTPFQALHFEPAYKLSDSRFLKPGTRKQVTGNLKHITCNMKLVFCTHVNKILLPGPGRLIHHW